MCLQTNILGCSSYERRETADFGFAFILWQTMSGQINITKNMRFKNITFILQIGEQYAILAFI